MSRFRGQHGSIARGLTRTGAVGADAIKSAAAQCDYVRRTLE
jgi:hypothetical protein